MIKKHFKKLVSVALAAVMVMGMSLTAFAAEPNDCLAILDDGTKVVAAYRVVNGTVEELSKDEYLELKTIESQFETQKQAMQNSHKKTITTTPRIGGVPFTRFDERGHIENYTKTSSRTSVSNYVYNRSSNPAELTISGSITKGAEANYTLSSGEKSAIKQEVGVSYSTSYTFTQEIKATISAKRKGWMEFTPIMYNSYGYIQKGVTTDISPFYVISSETWTDVYFPKQLPNGQLDGIYEIMESSL